MDIYVLERKVAICEKIGIIENYKSLIWNPMYYGQGSFEMVVPVTEDNLKMIKPFNILTREIDETFENGKRIFKSPMVIREISFKYDDEDGAMITVRGVSLKSHVLGSRVVDDYTILSGNAEAEIYGLMEDIFLDLGHSWREWPGYQNAPLKGYTETTNIQLFGENVAEWMEETCRNHRFGWDMNLSISGKTGSYSAVTFELYKGVNRTSNQNIVLPVIFSKANDNLINSEYEINYSNYATNCLVAGTEMPSSDKKWHIMTDDSPYGVYGQVPRQDARFETFLDSGISTEDYSSVPEYRAALNAVGLQQIAQSKTHTFLAEIDPDGMYKLNRDYFLGDIVEVRTEYGINAKARIEEIIYAIDENGTSVVPSFGDWEVMD